MKLKSDAFATFVTTHTRFTTQHGIKVKKLQCDRDGSFLSGPFREYTENHGIEYKLTTHDTPQHNGVAERAHLTLFNGVRAVLIAAKLPTWLWGYALDYCVFIHNVSFNRIIGMSPIQKRTGESPTLANVYPWGCKVIVRIEKPTHKLAPRGAEGHWLGYNSQSNGSFIYWVKNKTISVERNFTIIPADKYHVVGEQDIDETYFDNIDIGPIEEIDPGLLVGPGETLEEGFPYQKRIRQSFAPTTS